MFMHKIILTKHITSK